MPKVLSDAEIEQFVHEGYVSVREAFSRDVAAQCRDFLWHHMGLSPNDRTGWSNPIVAVRECFEQMPFAAALTPRLYGAFDDLLGEGRWNENTKVGGWPITFPGFARPPWQAPQTGWHVDGNWFCHHLNSPDQGLLPIFLFSDIGPGDGGTAICPGSHQHVARLLASAEPAGIPYVNLCEIAETLPRVRVIETQGQAGDVVLTHPFILHATSMNTGDKVRFICNPPLSLKATMQFARADGAHSAVERAVVEALAAEPEQAIVAAKF